MILFGNNGSSQGLALAQISNTNLWFVKGPDWGTSLDHLGYGFSDLGAWDYYNYRGIDDRWNDLKGQTSNYTGKVKDNADYNLTQKTYYFTSSGTSNLEFTKVADNGNWPENTLQTYSAWLRVRLSEDGGSSYPTYISEGDWPCSLTLQGTKIKRNGNEYSSDTPYGSRTGDEAASATTSGYQAEYTNNIVTGLVTMTLNSISNSAYEFTGWGTGDSPSSTGDTKEYHITANTLYYAFFKRKQFAVTFAPKGTYGTSTVTAKIGSSAITSGSSYNYNSAITFTANPATGYKLYSPQAWYSDASCETSLSNGTSTTYNIASLTSAQTVYVKFVPKQATISFSNTGTGYGSGGQSSTKTATYGSAMPTTISVPTAAAGYKFLGYYDSEGTQYYTAAGASARSWDKNTEDGVTLYARFQKAAITDFTFDKETAAASIKVTVTPVIEPTPVGPTYICWALYSDEYCTQKVDTVTFREDEGNAVWFYTPSVAGVYYLKAVFRTASDCSVADNGADVLSTHIEPYVVAEDHTITIKYMCGDAEIAPRGSVVVPAASTASVTALTGASVFGYTFSTWEIDEGSGVTKTSGSLTSTTITISTTYDATIVAKYTEKPIVYFKNTLGWSNVYVTYDAYWDDNTSEASGADRADGANGLGTGNYGKTYHQMTRLGDTDIWYDEIPAAHVSTWKHWIAFNDREQSGYSPADFTKNGNYKHFSGNIIYRKDFEPNHTMFVPAPTSVCSNFTKGNGTYVSCKQTTTGFYDGGYWIKRNSTNSDYSFRSELMWGSWDDATHVFKSAQAGDSVYTLSANLSSNYNYYFRVFKNYGESNNYSVAYKYKGNSATVDIAHETDLRLEGGDGNTTFKAATAGEYIFTLVFKKNGTIQMSVKYPMYGGDFQVMYYDTKQGKWHPAGIINHNETENITSFFVRKNKSPQIKWRRSTAVSNTGAITWGSFTNIDLSSYTASGKILYNDPTDTTGVYNFHFSIANNALSLADVTAYTGDFYIRTATAGTTGWADYRQEDHKMTYSDYSISQAKDPYSHYWMQWVLSGTKTEYTIANDYSPCISDTLTTDTYATSAGGALPANANVRFTWNKNNNALKRAYLSGGQDDGSEFLVLQGEATKLLAPDGSALHHEGESSGNNKKVQDNAIQLTDNMNWVYKTSVKAVPGGKIKLYAKYNNAYQYFIGKSPLNDWSTEGAYDILVGGTGDAQPISIIYDFKTNRMIAAWEPADTTVGALVLNADILIVREHQEASHNIIFKAKEKTAGSLTTSKTVYGVMRFNRFVLNNRSKEGGHEVLPANQQLPLRERNHYYISFPFDVNVSDIFGFGTYGVHWVLQYYDGKARAKNGLWADPGMTYWKYVPPTGKLNAYEGYLLALSPSQMAYEKTSTGEVWANSRYEVELYFPDATMGANIVTEDCTIPAPNQADYECTIWRGRETNEHAGDPNYDRRIADSYWRCIGVPSFANYNTTLGDGTSSFSWVKEEDYTSGDIHFLYDIDWVDYSLVAKSGSTFNFKAMHSYMIQNSTQIVWTGVNKIHNVVARRQRTEDIHDFEIRLELNQNGKLADQTFVRLTDDDNVTTGFEFGHDLSKELYSTKANIFTYIGYEPVAANSMPYSDGITIVPVGLKLATDGDYTFALPDGANGVGVTLVDNVENIRTNLSALDYTVNLTAGDYTNRFTLEISPIKNTPTSIEEVSSDEAQAAGVRKVIIDGVLYIVKDGKMYDARGSRVQ